MLSLMKKPKLRFAYVTNPHGQTIDIPEKHLAQTLKRANFTFIGWVDEQDEEIEEMFKGDDDDGDCTHCEGKGCVACDARKLPQEIEQKNNYNRSPQDEKAEVDALNKASDEQFERTHPGGLGTVTTEVIPKDHIVEADKKVVDKPMEKKKPTPKKKPKKTTKK